MKRSAAESELDTPDAVTTTSTGPATTPDGTTASIRESDSTLNRAATPPNDTEVADANPDPDTTTDEPTGPIIPHLSVKSDGAATAATGQAVAAPPSTVITDPVV